MPPDFDPLAPFALLWDDAARAGRLFTAPHALIETADIGAGLAAMRAAIASGDWLAGGLSYEAGHALEPRLAGKAHGTARLWFGRFGRPAMLAATDVASILETHLAPAMTGPVEPLVAPADFIAAVGKAQALIAAGDIYQANLTFRAIVPFRGHPVALFARLFRPGAAPHAALVHLGGGRWWLSLSPELFFRLEGGQITARPMKGTASRGASAAADDAAARALAEDPKNRAENLMITDLLRNDLARIAMPGSVRVPRLFAIERYPSILQMTSTVTARIAPGRDATDALAALFPCGSVTGAPKIRAMEVIAALEESPRGIYCGSIGWMAPDGDAGFNVAIRTLEIEGGSARLGLGAGIVADSDPMAEWRECLAKARFLEASAPRTLIETMRLDADGAIPRLRQHLDRLDASARRFGFPFDRQATAARLAGLRPGSGRRLRLLLSAEGHIALQLSPLPTPLAGPRAGPLRVALAPLPVSADDWRLRHKTGDRAFYDEARRASGADEVLFVGPDGLLTEGSFTSLFLERDGRLLTPPLRLGLLPGALRAELLENGRAMEAELRPADLAGGFLVGNSLRGLMPALLAGA